eukprot:8563535-Ditylum_brightwellii.AAC.1
MDGYVFCNKDHGYDGRSITELFTVVCLMPMMWLLKRKKFVHTSTFGPEFTALKAVVEEAAMLQYYLESMGIK